MQLHHILLLASPLAARLASAAQSPNESPQVSIYTDVTHTYEYHGCYNETTQVEGSAETRALSGGTSEVKPGEMTAPMCLSFCSSGRTKYLYAGLEWSRECWCAQYIAGIAAKLDDAQCNYPCEGNKSMACGGSLKLSIYRLSAAPRGVAVSRWSAVALALTAALLLS